MCIVDIRRIYGISFSQQHMELKNKIMDKVHSDLFPGNGNEVAAHTYLHGLKFFNEFYVPVMFTQETSQEVIVCKADLLNRTEVWRLLQ